MIFVATALIIGVDGKGSPIRANSEFVHYLVENIYLSEDFKGSQISYIQDSSTTLLSLACLSFRYPQTHLMETFINNYIHVDEMEVKLISFCLHCSLCY